MAKFVVLNLTFVKSSVPLYLLHILSFLYPVFKVLKPVSDFSSLTSLLGLSLTSFDVKLMVGSNGLEPSTSRLSGVRSNHLSYEPMYVAGSLHRPTCLRQLAFRLAAGGDEQNRTVDPLLARQVLSQLSYAPISTGLLPFGRFHHRGLNPQN